MYITPLPSAVDFVFSGDPYSPPPAANTDFAFSDQPSESPLAVTGPDDAAVSAGDPAVFVVVASGGTPPYFYQWHDVGIGALPETTDALTISTVAADDGRQFYAVVTDSAAAEVTSQTATLAIEVEPPEPPEPPVEPPATPAPYTPATLVEWERFVSCAPESQREYRTIEVWHPQLQGVFYFVSNYTDVALTLEPDAPRFPGETINFKASTLKITEPSEREDSEQAISIVMGNVDSTIHDMIDKINGSGFFSSVSIVYRKYYSGNLSLPAVPPLYLSASTVQFDGAETVAVTAEDADLAQKRSGILYTVEKFPGLRD